MSTEEFHRKLTAILSADVQGYSRLMGEDEESTVRTLTAYRELMSSLIRDHRGQVVDTPGDNLLAKFDSGTDAVRCAVEIQEELRIRNADLPENRKMLFRIGINLGDVIEEGDRIYGDGINVAARIEGLAEGGGICISGFVYGAIKNKLSLSYEFQGEHNVKNIKDPVRVYSIRMEPGAAAPIVKEKASKVRTWQRVAFPVVAIFILGIVAVWYFSFRHAPGVSDVEETQKTIAVLPFADLSPEKDQEYFVDGLSEEILNSLAQIPELKVIARTSSFSFKGTTKKIQEIANELGVAHILEGSVRKAGNALRITAQLVKGVDGSHLWSKTYDRELKDIFVVQEDIATTVADELKVTLGINKSLKQLGGTANEKAYELYLIAKGQIPNSEFVKAFKSIDEALAIDPEFALAWTLKAFIYNALTLMVATEELASVQNFQLKAVQRAIELEPNLAEAYASLGDYYTTKGEWLSAETNYQKAITLFGEPALNLGVYPNYLFSVGYIERANEFLKKALQIDPFNEIIRTNYIFSFGILGDIQQAEKEFDRMREVYGDTGNFGDITIAVARIISGGDVTSDEIISTTTNFGPDTIPNASNIWDGIIANIDSPKLCIAELHHLYADSENLPSGYLINISMLAAYFGDNKLAIEAMGKALKRNAAIGRIIWSPIYHEVRQLPQFKELVREIDLVDYWEQFGYPDLCHPTDDGDFVCD